MKRVLAFLMTLCLLAGLGVVASAESVDPYGRYDEPITITILSRDNKSNSTVYDSSDPARRSASENAWISAYEEYLNIKVERIIAEDNTAVSSQINARLASDDLPDVVMCDKSMLYNLVENEACQDLLPALEGYTQSNYLAQCLSEEFLNFGMVDGKLMGFPITNNWYNGTQLLWVRQDWLDKVNMKAPTTLDEMVAVARAFKEAKLGGEDTIGLGMANDQQYSDYRGILAAYGAVYNTWTKQEDGSYIFANVSDTMKDGLLFIQKLYAEGLIKSDFAVSNILSEEIANGRVGMYYASGWHSVTDLKTNMINDPEAEWICVPIPTLDGQRVKQFTNASCNMFAVVTNGCEHPEAIFKMMELEQKMYTNPDPEDIPKLYTTEDGFPMWDLRIFRNFGRSDFDLYRSKLINEHLAAKHTAKDVEPVIYDFYTQCEAALAGDRSLEGRYLCQTMAYPIVAELLEDGLLVAEYSGKLTENMQLYQKTINAELNSAMVKVIMGEDISVFEQAVTQWYQNGGQAITDEVSAYYQGK